MVGRGGHRAALEPLALPASALTALEAYLDLLAAWGSRVNLTALRTPEARVALLVTPVLAFAPRLPGGRLIDVGSGNGSPGLVLALLRPDIEVTLLEPRLRRWAFLREAARAAGARVEVQRCRHDAHGGPAAGTVSVRALALSLRDLAPLVEPGGLVVVMGPPPTAEPGFAPLDWGLPGVHAQRRLSAARST